MEALPDEIFNQIAEHLCLTTLDPLAKLTQTSKKLKLYVDNYKKNVIGIYEVKRFGEQLYFNKYGKAEGKTIVKRFAGTLEFNYYRNGTLMFYYSKVEKCVIINDKVRY